MTETALSGLRVVDLTRILAGPFCTLLLADMGAEVIKIESAAGDPIRRQGATKDGISWYYAQFNRNKKSVILDLYSEAGKADLTDLLAGADVVVENYRPGVFATMGFTPERLAEINPRLIHAGISGYGVSGPYVDRPSFDFIAQAMSGFMSMNGPPDGDPMRAAPPISDLVAGLYCAFGVLAAVQARTHTGLGQQVETSLTTGLISMMAYLSAEYFATGKVPRRTGNNHPIVAPYGLFRARDGMVAVAPSNEIFVHRFLEVLGLKHLLEEPRFLTNADRMANRDALIEIITATTRTETVDHWIAAINQGGCPCGRVMDLAEVFADPQVQAQEMVLEVDHPGHGSVKMTGFPVKLSHTPAKIHRPAPDLGSDTEAVLGALRRDRPDRPDRRGRPQKP